MLQVLRRWIALRLLKLVLLVVSWGRGRVALIFQLILNTLRAHSLPDVPFLNQVIRCLTEATMLI